MKIILRMIILAVIPVVSFVSCQDLFTNSVFSFVEIDMSTMSYDQKVSYAEDLLVNGSEEEIEAAYIEILKLLDDVDLDSSDLTQDELDLVTLGADLAIGASGVGDAVSAALDGLASGEGSEDAGALADSFLNSFDGDDYENLKDAADLIKVAESNDVVLTPQQYTNASAALLLVVLNDVSTLGLESPDQLDDAIAEQAEMIEDLKKALEWAEAGGLDPSLFGDGIAVPAS